MTSPLNPIRDRMFHVIVLGGLALVGLEGCGAVADKGGGPEPLDAAIDGHLTDAHSTVDGFPVEGLSVIVDAFPSETATQIDAFPSEGPAFPDAFPSESDPRPVDAGCFPQETAIALDASSCGQGGK